MELKDILTIAIASLAILVVAHIAVFGVVRTLYPPTPIPVSVSIPSPPPPPATFIEPPSIEQQQHVTLPTYETSVLPKPISKEELRTGPPPAEATAIQRDTGVAIPDA